MSDSYIGIDQEKDIIIGGGRNKFGNGEKDNEFQDRSDGEWVY